MTEQQMLRLNKKELVKIIRDQKNEFQGKLKSQEQSYKQKLINLEDEYEKKLDDSENYVHQIKQERDIEELRAEDYKSLVAKQRKEHKKELDREYSVNQGYQKAIDTMYELIKIGVNND